MNCTDNEINEDLKLANSSLSETIFISLGHARYAMLFLLCLTFKPPSSLLRHVHLFYGDFPKFIAIRKISRNDGFS